MISGPGSDRRQSERKPLNIRFPLGRLFITPNAQAFLAEQGINPAAFLVRHLRCDWGDVDTHDWDANDRALVDGTRLLSAYEIPNCSQKVWIITEADRSSTTVLLPNDY